MEAAEKHQRFEELLRAWTERVNLIGPEARRNLRDHIDEAREAGQLLRPTGNCLDFGSGGGLPAIPIAIDFPDARFTLVEADQKKWAFLKHVGRECALKLRVLGDRLETLVADGALGGPFETVTSRAVGYAEQWLPLLSPAIAEGGRVALFESSDSAPEIAGFECESATRLQRGTNNYLIVLRRIAAI